MASRRSTAFTEADYADSYAVGMEHHWWTRARADIVHRAIGRFPPGLVLDVGCGPGLTVGYLRQRGLDCLGCEVGRPEVRADVAQAVFTATDAVDLDPSLRARVHVILLLDVLEHIEDPAAFLRRLCGAFPNLRGLVATVPARQELWSAWDQRYGHFRRYDRSSAAAVLTAGGFSAVRTRYFFHALYPVMWLSVRMFGRRTTERPPPRESLFHRVLGALFAREARALPGALIGTSILASARLDATDGPRNEARKPD